MTISARIVRAALIAAAQSYMGRLVVVVDDVVVVVCAPAGAATTIAGAAPSATAAIVPASNVLPRTPNERLFVPCMWSPLISSTVALASLGAADRIQKKPVAF